MRRLFLLSLLISSSLYSKDFGIHGHIFPIKERDLKTELEEKAKGKKDPELLEKALRTSKILKAAPQIPNAKKDRSFLFDPTLVLEKDITDGEGKVLFAKGTRVNPLENKKLSTGLLFLDGENPAHLQWASHQRKAFRWVLVKGNPFQIEEEFEREVYFDQFGSLCNRLKLEAIPAKVTQKEDRLLVEEIVLRKVFRSQTLRGSHEG